MFYPLYAKGGHLSQDFSQLSSPTATIVLLYLSVTCTECKMEIQCLIRVLNYSYYPLTLGSHLCCVLSSPLCQFCWNEFLVVTQYTKNYSARPYASKAVVTLVTMPRKSAGAKGPTWPPLGRRDQDAKWCIWKLAQATVGDRAVSSCAKVRFSTRICRSSRGVGGQVWGKLISPQTSAQFPYTLSPELWNEYSGKRQRPRSIWLCKAWDDKCMQRKSQ